MIYFGILIEELLCYCGDNVKYRPLSKRLLAGKQQDGGGKLRVMISIAFIKNNILYLPVMTKNKKHSSKQVAPMTYTLVEKRVFCSYYF